MADYTDETKAGSGGSTAGTPRWVKIFAAVIAIVVLFLIVSTLLGVKHGPGRHLSPGDHKPPSSVTESGHRPPAGH